MSIGHSGNVHVEFSHAISYFFLGLSCGFALLIIQPVNLLRSFLPTNLNFALQFKEYFSVN